MRAAMTQFELSMVSGFSQAAIALIEMGKRAITPVERVRLASALRTVEIDQRHPRCRRPIANQRRWHPPERPW